MIALSLNPGSGRTAFAAFYLGGLGQKTGERVHAWVSAQRDLPNVSITLDTDSEPDRWSGNCIRLGMTESRARAVIANHQAFGQDVSAVVEMEGFSRLVRPEHLERGSKTTRPVTQFLFASQRDRIIAGCRHALIKLRNSHEGRFSEIIPLFISSTGGGAGSALQILLVQAFQDPAFRTELLAGLRSDMLKPPVLFVADPYAYAHNVHLDHNPIHRDRILANAYAFRCESAVLEQQRAFTYCYHVGFASARTNIDTDDKIVRALGSSVCQVMRHWSALESRYADIWRTAIENNRFTGQ